MSKTSGNQLGLFDSTSLGWGFDLGAGGSAGGRRFREPADEDRAPDAAAAPKMPHIPALTYRLVGDRALAAGWKARRRPTTSPQYGWPGKSRTRRVLRRRMNRSGWQSSQASAQRTSPTASSVEPGRGFDPAGKTSGTSSRRWFRAKRWWPSPVPRNTRTSPQSL